MLAGDISRVRVIHHNHFYVDSSGDQGGCYSKYKDNDK